MGNTFPRPVEDEAVEEAAQEEVASNYEESDHETNEYVPVEIDNNIHNELVKEVSSDDFRDSIEEYWLNKDWIEVARKLGVGFIEQQCIILGFKPQTAYLAVIYFTRFLSTTQEIEVIVNEAEYSWFIKDVMSVACLFVSAKMEEVVVPTLSSFCVNAQNFNEDAILRMELILLKRLQWIMSLITPFTFTGFFAEKLTEIFGVPIVSSRVEYAIMSSMKDAKTFAYRPSVVALAATLVAVDDYKPTTTDDMRLRINPLVTELAMYNYEVIVCYIRIRGMVGQQRTGHLGRPRVYLTTVARGKGMMHTNHYFQEL